jgi:soluble lytic murein transglycosylase-like protein
MSGTIRLGTGGAALAALLLAGAASADGEIERKLATLRALTRPADEVLPPVRLGRLACSAGRADRADPADLTLARLRAIHDASRRYAVSADLIRSVIRHESAGNPAAVSHKGAMGLMQLMPGTARELGVVCAFDPRQNIMGGTRYLRELRDRFGSWREALAAYNAGPGRVESGRWPAETRRYVENVMRSWRGV